MELTQMVAAVIGTLLGMLLARMAAAYAFDDPERWMQRRIAGLFLAPIIGLAGGAAGLWLEEKLAGPPAVSAPRVRPAPIFGGH